MPLYRPCVALLLGIQAWAQAPLLMDTSESLRQREICWDSPAAARTHPIIEEDSPLWTLRQVGTVFAMSPGDRWTMLGRRCVLMNKLRVPRFTSWSSLLSAGSRKAGAGGEWKRFKHERNAHFVDNRQETGFNLIASVIKRFF